MAGFVNAKIKLAESQAELERVKAQLANANRILADHGLGAASSKRHRIVSREFDDRIIDELIQWSEEGLFLDECLAAWGIDMDTWQGWLRVHVDLQAAVGPSRARARAAMLRTMREALKSRNAFPTSLADRIIAMVEREHGASDEQSSHLVSIEFCPRCAAADALSAETDTQVIDLAAPGATPSGSHS